MTNIGVIDSGVGGLTVLFDVIEKYPNCNYYYLGDSKNCPYGDKSVEEIKAFSKSIVEYLIVKHNISILIIACNSISSTSYNYLKEIYKDLIIIETVVPTTNYVKNYLDSKKIGLIATCATINSNSYQEKLKKYEVISKACPNFVKIIESGPITLYDEKIIIKDLLEVIETNIDTLILGCTHYPLLIPIIKKIYNKNIVTSSIPIIKELEKHINTDNNIGNVIIYSTGNKEEFESKIKLLFNKNYKVIGVNLRMWFYELWG